NGGKVEITRQDRSHLGFACQFDEVSIEAFSLEETLIHRDVARNVKAVTADHLADGDLGLGVGGCEREAQRQGGGYGREQVSEHSHGTLLSQSRSKRDLAISGFEMPVEAWPIRGKVFRHRCGLSTNGSSRCRHAGRGRASPTWRPTPHGLDQ